MIAKKYFADWESSRAANRVLTLTVLVLVVVLAILAVMVAVKRETVVLVPPNLEDRASVSTQDANEAYQVSWGLYVATLLGNITPSTAPFLSQQLGKHLSPALYDTVLKSIDDQAKQITQEQIKVSFAPKLADYKPETKTVVVTGDLSVRDARGQERSEVRTYELGFEVHNYQPLLTLLKVSTGAWHAKPLMDVDASHASTAPVESTTAPATSAPEAPAASAEDLSPPQAAPDDAAMQAAGE